MAKDLRSALEAALRENPDDLAAHMAYGDMLMEQGDPRGELVQVQLALENASRPAEERGALLAREKELLDAHSGEWLGPIAAMFGAGEKERPFGMEYHWLGGESGCRWSRGWLEEMHLSRINPEAVAALAHCPAAGLLREFAIVEDETDYPALDGLARLPFLGTLRKFRLGAEPNEANCHFDGEGVVPVLRKLPHLEELLLCAHGVPTDEVFALPFPRLRSLTVHHLHEYRFDVLAANPTLGNLVALHCWPHGL